MAPGVLFDPLDVEQYIQDKSQTHDVNNQVRHWPSILAGDLVWDGSMFADEDDYTYELRPQEKLEVEAALVQFKS